MSINIASIPLRSASLFADAPAILLDDKVISYRMLKQQIIYCAQALRAQGVGPGDHVAIMLPNIPQFTVNYFAIAYLGAVVVPLNILFVEDELRYHLDDCDAKALIVWHAFLQDALPAARSVGVKNIFVCCPADNKIKFTSELIDQAQAMQQAAKTIDVSKTQAYASKADDTAVILYTSGTTGRAKGAELSHFNMFDNARFVSERIMRTGLNSLSVFSCGDVALATLPLFHSFGQTCIQNGFLMNGAAISLLPRFNPVDVARQIQAHKVTFFAGVPSMYIALINHPDVSVDQLSSLNYAVSGGAALPVDVLDQFKQKYAIDILEGYGLSETSPVACFNNLVSGCKPGTVGPAIDLCEVKAVDDNNNKVAVGERGEIAIKGTNVMKGYYKKAKETREVLKDGWFYTGDIGIISEDGYVSIVDRKKEMILRGGYNIYPREIEEVLYAHPDITEAAVIGVPDAQHGEDVMAIYVLCQGAELEHDALEKYCREHLAAYKVPRKSQVVESLPKGPTGKILKRVIKEKYIRS